ncbi:hypothetical protein L228DRAFT_14885 [Xylona heveae TC161]|uniref:Uncharacterized protein n=1 Tax=Xylona heveae (strain CBS 132557 / TC161) TaxID=1328760 RepID=A0A165JS03_XYLHT|nr:hypothetical protein L228DRAFT_14885 [Xylona heveae TC161]KZF26556.1 hypothetical protein L228DRAFT_14885 [Xylona heveae TC161]
MIAETLPHELSLKLRNNETALKYHASDMDVWLTTMASMGADLTTRGNGRDQIREAFLQRETNRNIERFTKVAKHPLAFIIYRLAPIRCFRVEASISVFDTHVWTALGYILEILKGLCCTLGSMYTLHVIKGLDEVLWIIKGPSSSNSAIYGFIKHCFQCSRAMVVVDGSSAGN